MMRVFLFIFLMLFSQGAWADYVTLSSSGDNCLDPTNVTTNNSTGTDCGSQVTHDDYAYVINFDLSSLSGKTVQQALLTFYESTRGSAHNIVISRVLQPWIYTTSTWNIYNTGLNWNTAGAKGSATDFTTTNQITVANQNPGNIIIDVTGMVNDMITNNQTGFIIRASDNLGFDRYNMRGNASNKPSLVVVYSGSNTNYCASDAKGCWLFNEGSGTAVADSSGNSNTGTFTTPAWVSTPLPSRTYIKYAASFNGTTDKISAGTTANLLPTTASTPWSGCAWFYTADSGTTPRRIIDKSSGTTGPDININGSNVLTFQVAGGTTMVHTTNTGIYSINTWTHVCATWDGSTTAANSHIYVNGIEATSYITVTNGATFTDNSASNFLIGSRNTDNTRVWDKYLTEIGVWNRVLSQAEVMNIYNDGLGVPTTHFDTIQGNSIIQGGSVVN